MIIAWRVDQSGRGAFGGEGSASCDWDPDGRREENNGQASAYCIADWLKVGWEDKGRVGRLDF